MSIFDTIAQSPEVLTIPVVAGVIGWFTNWLAVKMMFHPTEFVGIKPFLGWQGIVPANALRLANTGLKLITSQLLRVPELFEDFDSKKFVDENGQRIRALTRKSIEEKASAHFPQMWAALSPAIKEQVYTLAENEVMKVSSDVMEQAAERIEDLLDVEQVVTDAVLADKGLMSKVFLTVGAAEFKFIEISGLYFGFLFGLVQMLVWLLYPAVWVLPVFGFLVGYVTNWLALKLIFEPRKPTKFGPFTVQGLFHKRQADISKGFSEIVSKRVFTGENLFAEFGKDSSRRALMNMVREKARALIEKYKQNPMAATMATPALVEQLEKDLLTEVEAEMYRPDGMIFEFTNKSDDIREKLMERMSVMDPEPFENVLRPAFKQDEWKLILAGAALGLAAGIVQLVTMFADQVL
ncbi:MAG: hypothetical protein KC635_02905 [Myxococcales bacterium]|nr:hypothetical protein [Myxococcales bacterium]MCB9733751.1 hypothetical protein [Deltaproteobacteria bacterium]